MQDPNTHQEQVDTSAFYQTQEMPETTVQQAEKPESQPQGQEEIEVEGEKIPTLEIDNLKSYKFFQSKFTQEQQEKQRIKEELIRKEERLKFLEESLKPKETRQQTAPERPVKPVRPQGYNRVDATTDPDSPSGKFDDAMFDYNDKMDSYREHKDRMFEQERELLRQQQEFAQRRNAKIAELQAVPGVTLEEAMETFDWINTPDSIKPENVIAYRRQIKGLKNPKPIQGQTVGQILPPVAIPSKAEPKTDESQEFVGSFGQRNIRNLFKTQ